MKNEEIEKSKILNVEAIIDYEPNGVMTKIIFKRATGQVTAISLDAGVSLPAKASPFDTFIQVIEGKSEITIDQIAHVLDAGQVIIIPANTHHIIRAHERFKLLSTIIKSGYEELLLS